MFSLKIELRVSFKSGPDEEARKQGLVEAAKMAAKHMHTTALLLMDGREPSIALYSDDMFIEEKEISLAEDIDTTPYGSCPHCGK